jgi:hypothetical protein
MGQALSSPVVMPDLETGSRREVGKGDGTGGQGQGIISRQKTGQSRKLSPVSGGRGSANPGIEIDTRIPTFNRVVELAVPGGTIKYHARYSR